MAGRKWKYRPPGEAPNGDELYKVVKIIQDAKKAPYIKGKSKRPQERNTITSFRNNKA